MEYNLRTINDDDYWFIYGLKKNACKKTTAELTK